MAPSLSVRMMASFARSNSSVWSIRCSVSSMSSASQAELLSCLLSRRGRSCVCARTRLGGVACAKFLETSGVEDVIERHQRAQHYQEEKKHTRGAQPAVGRAPLLPDSPLPHQFELEQAQRLLRIGWFRLAVPVGFHREGILTIQP